LRRRKIPSFSIRRPADHQAVWGCQEFRARLGG
jgi:hypothetical protein